jgi:hypothetical protein
VFPRPEIVAYATALLERRPSIVAGLPICQGRLPASLMKVAPVPTLFISLAAATAEGGEKRSVLPIVGQLIADRPSGVLSTGEFDRLFAELYPL